MTAQKIHVQLPCLLGFPSRLLSFISSSLLSLLVVQLSCLLGFPSRLLSFISLLVIPFYLRVAMPSNITRLAIATSCLVTFSRSFHVISRRLIMLCQHLSHFTSFCLVLSWLALFVLVLLSDPFFAITTPRYKADSTLLIFNIFVYHPFGHTPLDSIDSILCFGWCSLHWLRIRILPPSTSYQLLASVLIVFLVSNSSVNIP